jgi:hypothetical protein
LEDITEKIEKKVFYSWQSDLDNNINRTLIQKCLEAAIRNVSNGQLDIDPVLDRGTLGWWDILK